MLTLNLRKGEVEHGFQKLRSSRFRLISQWGDQNESLFTCDGPKLSFLMPIGRVFVQKRDLPVEKPSRSSRIRFSWEISGRSWSAGLSVTSTKIPQHPQIFRVAVELQKLTLWSSIRSTHPLTDLLHDGFETLQPLLSRRGQEKTRNRPSMNSTFCFLIDNVDLGRLQQPHKISNLRSKYLFFPKWYEESLARSSFLPPLNIFTHPR
jgi:hypothetical protein